MPRDRFTLSDDGDLVQTLKFRNEGTGLVMEVEQMQRSRKGFLNMLSEIRKNKGIVNHFSFMGWEMSIPYADWAKLIKIYPELVSKDRETNTRAWDAFLACSDFDCYRMRDRKRKVGTT